MRFDYIISKMLTRDLITRLLQELERLRACVERSSIHWKVSNHNNLFSLVGSSNTCNVFTRSSMWQYFNTSKRMSVRTTCLIIWTKGPYHAQVSVTIIKKKLYDVSPTMWLGIGRSKGHQMSRAESCQYDARIICVTKLQRLVPMLISLSKEKGKRTLDTIFLSC